MTRTHHAVRTWRLSCGCLRDYPGMSLGQAHPVLCATCGTSVTTLYVYPEHCCGYTTTAQRPDAPRISHVCCTNSETSKDCARGVHYDRYVQIQFRAPAKLRSSDEGQTRRH